LNPVNVDDALPAGFTYLDAYPLPDDSGQISTWDNIGPLTPGASAVIHLNATVDDGTVNASTQISTLTNYVNATGFPPDGSNVSAQSSADVTVYYANVSVIELNQTAAQASLGGIVQFNLTVTNTGNVTLDPTQVIDSLPQGL